MLLPILAGVALVPAGLAAFVATRPSAFRVARSRTITAPPAVAQAFVNDQANFASWSPWQKIDPAVTNTVSTPSAGVGSTFDWTGNKQVGAGRMTITSSTPGRTVTMTLEFFRPFATTNTVAFDFVPRGSGTHVTWAMTGTNGFMMKAFGLFMDMDKMVGKDFDQGLANLDAVTAPAAVA